MCKSAQAASKPVLHPPHTDLTDLNLHVKCALMRQVQLQATTQISMQKIELHAEIIHFVNEKALSGCSGYLYPFFFSFFFLGDGVRQ